MVWKIIGILLALLLLIVVAVLLLPVRLRISAGSGRQPSVELKVLFLSFDLNSDKEKKGKKKAPLTEEKKGEKKSADLVGKVEQAVDFVKASLESIGWLIGKIKASRLYVRAVCGGEDAAQTAMEYGLICAVLYPLVGLLEANLRIDPRARQLEIGCDFDSKQAEFEFDLILSLRVYHAAQAVAKIVLKKISQDAQERVAENEG